MGGLRVLRAAAAAEVVTLLAMLTNLVTVHAEAVSSVLGPLHGGSYLTVIVAVLVLEGAPTRARVLAFVPGVGGYLASRAVTSSGGAA